jgi:hypothetical protein
MNKISPEALDPDFHLQPNEVLLQTLRFRKYRKPNFLQEIIYTVISLGLYLLFRHLFKKLKSIEIVKLTNKRIIEWEYEVPPRGCCGGGNGKHVLCVLFLISVSAFPDVTRMDSYQLSDLSYYQLEYVQDHALMKCCLSMFDDCVIKSCNVFIL